MKRINKFTRVVAAAIVFCMLFAFTSCFGDMGVLKVKSFTVDRSSVKTEYFIGEEIDFSGIKINVTYSDETLNTIYTHENAKINVTFNQDITKTAGTKNVIVSMVDPNTDEDKSTPVQITVTEDPNAVKFDRYEIDSSAVKTEYNVGEIVDFTGIKVFEVMSDETKTELENLTNLSYEYNGAPLADSFTEKAGTKAVTVKYNGKNAGVISITVTDPEKETVKVNSMTVGGTYKSLYEVGDTADFTGLTVTLVYENGETRTIEYADLTFSALNTQEAGRETVTISFTDPINDVESSTSVEVTVIERLTVDGFEKPTSITAFESDNKTEGKPVFGDSTFSGTFVNGGLTYKVGDDNSFKFLPTLTVEKENNQTELLTRYYSAVELSIDGTALTKEADGTNVTYKSGDTVIAVVDTYNGLYDFTEEAIGSKVKISVLPDETYFKLDGANSVVFEVEVIDAFNVYSAKELSVVDNYNSDWDTLYPELATVNPSGIVLHADISITENDVPESFFRLSTADAEYENNKGEVVKEIPAGSKFLIDGTTLYFRAGEDDFTIEGNFYQITTENFPLVASPGIFENADLNYGSDYSNAQLFYFRADPDISDPTDEQKPNINISNLALRGNAARNEMVDSEGKLVSGGGLIAIKSNYYAITTIDNTICNSYFITYFANQHGSEMYVQNSKCYDSFQNAAFIYGDTVLEIENSFLSGTGGPIMLADSVRNESNDNVYNPVIKVTNTVMDSALTGSELWFTSVGAGSLIGGIQAIGNGLAISGIGNFTNSDGKMNIMGLLMNEGTDAAAAIGNINCQGSILIDDKGILRWNETGNLWQTIVKHPAYASGSDPTKWAPFLTVGDGNDPSEVIFYNGLTFCDINGDALDPTNTAHQAIIGAFQTADTITLSQGGISIVFEFHHGADMYVPK